MITEQDIQRAFFAHLQEFYRYRYEYEPGTFTTERDALASGGIIADGIVRFVKPDGSPFIATFEATSLDKSEEVKFRRNPLYFLWDCFAFALLGTGSIVAFLYFFKLKMLIGLGLTAIFGMTLTLLLLLFSVWYFSFGGWRKYRYIYAIEQFKRYYADEQWVVLGADVLGHRADPYMQELRNQCTFNGFGLATVSAEGAVQVIATPSRIGIYGKDREDANWLTGSTAYVQLRKGWEYSLERASPLTALWNTITRPISYLVLRPVNTFIKHLSGINDGEFTRFMQSFSYQKGLSVLGLGLMSIVLWQTYRHPAFHLDREVNTREAFLKRRTADYVNPEDEPGYVYRETLPITYGGEDDLGVPKQYPAFKPEAKTASKGQNIPAMSRDGIEGDDGAIKEIDLTALRSGEPPAPEIESPITYSETTKEQPTTTAKGISKPKPIATKNWSWCTQLKGKSGWLVQDNYFVSSEGAEERLTQLRAHKLVCFSVDASCLGSKQTGTYVFFKELFATEDAAIAHLTSVRKVLKAKKIDTGRTIIKKL